MGAIEDWYDEPDRTPDTGLPVRVPFGLASTASREVEEFFDDPNDPLDMSRVPPKNAGLPFDVDVLNILAGGDGIASKPDILSIGQQLVTDVQATVNQITDIFNGLVVTPINNAVQGVKDWFANLVGWKSSVVSGATGTSAPLDNADAAAYDATKALFDQNQATALAAANAAAAVQQLNQNLNGKAGGVNKLLRFPVSAAISTTDWSYTAGVFVGSAKGELALAGSVANGYYSARSNYMFATDDQAAAAQLGQNATTQGTVLVLRADTAGTQGVAALIKSNYLAIGTISGFADGATNNAWFTTAASVSRTQSSGDSVEFRLVGDTFVILVNGAPVLSYGSALGSKGSSYRALLVIKQKAQPLFTEYSFDLTSLGVYDYGSAGASVTARTAARVSRTATGAVTTTINPVTATAFPANYFAVADFTQNMTVDDLGTGRVKALTADWYDIACSFSARATPDNTNSTNTVFYSPKWCLLVNGVQVTQGIPAGASIKWPLAANDIVQPAIWTDDYIASKWGSDSSYWYSRNLVLDRIGGGPGAFFQVVADV